MKKITVIIELIVDDDFNSDDEDILAELCTDFTIDLVNNNYLNNVKEAWLEDIETDYFRIQ